MLTAEENAHRMATLKEGGAGQYSIWQARAYRYAHDSPIGRLLRSHARGEHIDPAEREALITAAEHPALRLGRVFNVASAAREGEFRKDLVESQRAAVPQAMALAIPQGNSPANASVNVPVGEPAKRGI